MSPGAVRFFVVTSLSLSGACANTTETRTDVVVGREPVRLPPRERDWSIRATDSVRDGVLSMRITRGEPCDEQGERVTLETRAETRPSGLAIALDASVLLGGLMLSAQRCEGRLFCTGDVVGPPMLVGGGVALLVDILKTRDTVVGRRTEDRRVLPVAPLCREVPFTPEVLLVTFDGAAPIAARADALGVYRVPWPSPAPSRVVLSVPGAPLRGYIER